LFVVISEAAVAGQVALEATCGKLRQRQQDACSVIKFGGLQLGVT
jgi:hypothetical protein